jgi:hypothetical protein
VCVCVCVCVCVYVCVCVWRMLTGLGRGVSVCACVGVAQLMVAPLDPHTASVHAQFAFNTNAIFASPTEVCPTDRKGEWIVCVCVCVSVCLSVCLSLSLSLSLSISISLCVCDIPCVPSAFARLGT